MRADRAVRGAGAERRILVFRVVDQTKVRQPYLDFHPFVERGSAGTAFRSRETVSHIHAVDPLVASARRRNPARSGRRRPRPRFRRPAGWKPPRRRPRPVSLSGPGVRPARGACFFGVPRLLWPPRVLPVPSPGRRHRRASFVPGLLPARRFRRFGRGRFPVRVFGARRFRAGCFRIVPGFRSRAGFCGGCPRRFRRFRRGPRRTRKFPAGAPPGFRTARPRRRNVRRSGV